MNDILKQIDFIFSVIRNSKLVVMLTDAWLSPAWWQLLLFFLFCSFVMILRLNVIEKNGFEGTLTGTLVMPYFSGFPNLCFAYLMFRQAGGGLKVLENCMVNNITNLTLVLGIPCLFWGLNLFRGSDAKSGQAKIHHLSLLLSIVAMIFFSLALFFVSRDGLISRHDGMLLVSLFLFWQIFHVIEVLKTSIRKQQRIKKRILIDFIIIGFCAWGVFSSTDQLIQWVSHYGSGFFSTKNLGFLSGMLMVLPNAILAVYYCAAKRADIAYSSQIGDCHICIPLCIGMFAVFSPVSLTAPLQTALLVLIAASCGHLLFTAAFRRLPRITGLALAGLYAFFLFKEII